MAIQPSAGDGSGSKPGGRDLADAIQGDDQRSRLLTSWLVLVVLALFVVGGLILLAVRGIK